MNIHLKIEAKRLIHIKLDYIIEHNNLTRCEAIKYNYNNFNQDYFLLPYKVQKLSKRARRTTFIK